MRSKYKDIEAAIDRYIEKHPDAIVDVIMTRDVKSDGQGGATSSWMNFNILINHKPTKL